MSFVPRRYPAVRAAERKKKVRRKPTWDSTTNDLTVHRASPEEQTRRKMVHQSNNMDLVKADQMKKTLSKARNANNTKKPNTSLLREVLFDHSQLHAALQSSDKAMAVVKDIFGDDPRRFRGLPNVTTAPENTSLSGSLPDGSTLEGPFKLDVLSDSVMDKSALNDLEAVPSSESDADCEEDVGYEPGLDMQRFQRLLQQAEREEAKFEERSRLEERRVPRPVPQPVAVEVPVADIQDQCVDEPVTHDGSYLAATPTATPRPATAINDTENVKRTLARTSQEPPGGAEGQHEASSLADLKRVLDGSGDQLRSSQLEQEKTFSGFTISLVEAVDKLTSYVKETDMKLRAESLLREHLLEEVTQLKVLVDALTSDIIHGQEENASIHAQFTQFKAAAEQDIRSLKLALRSEGVELQNSSTSTAQGSVYSALPPALPPGCGPPPPPAGQTHRLVAPHDVRVSVSGGGSRPHDPPSPRPPGAAACRPAFMLSPPKQTMSPTMESRGYQPSIGAIQSAMRDLRQPARPVAVPAQQGAPPQPVAVPVQQAAPPRSVAMPVQQAAPQSAILSLGGSGDAPDIDHQMALAETERAALQWQLKELNLQHTDAQSKLRSLMDDHQLTGLSQENGQNKYFVSPSLSPISHASEQLQGSQSAAASQVPRPRGGAAAARGIRMGAPREILVAMPRMDTAGLTEESPSPPAPRQLDR